MPQVRPKRPASRLVGGLLWLLAAGVGIGGTFGDILSSTAPGGRSQVITGFWDRSLIVDGRTEEGPSLYYGIEVLIGAAFLLAAFLVALFTVRRWAAIVAGAFGAAMVVSAALHWYLVMAIEQLGTTYSIELGLWLVTGAAVLALAGLVVALAERAIPVFRPMYAPPPPPLPPPPPRWEPQTPRYGIPVQQPPAPEQPTTHLDQPEHTSSITPPNPMPETPEPGSISRKLDGDEK